MDRRAFIGTLAGALLAAPRAADAQQVGKVWRIGHLGHGFDPHSIETFRRELGERGYVEGKDITMEFRYSEGQVERLPHLAAELVRLRVDVIVARWYCSSYGTWRCHMTKMIFSHFAPSARSAWR